MTLAALLDVDPDRRLEALAALAPDQAPAHEAEAAVRDVLLFDEDASVRAAAAAWLGRARPGEPTFALALVDALYDSHPSVRLEACRALARRRVRDAGPLLGRLALEEPIWWVRRAAVLAFARLARREAIPLLRAVLDDPFWRVRHAAVRALLALAEALDDAGRAALVQRAGDLSARVHGALAYLEGRLGGGGAAPPAPAIEPPAGKAADPDPAVVTARLEAGVPATLAELVLCLGDPHEALRRAASARLQREADVRVLLAASLWLEEPRIPHATATVIALLDRTGAALEPLLDAALSDPDARPGLAMWALAIVARTARLQREADVLRAADASSPIVRRAAVHALGALARGAAHDLARERLVLALGDPDEDVRRLATHGLVEEGDPRGLAATLGLAYEAQPPIVRRLLVSAAARAGDTAALARAADDADPAARAAALRALAAREVLDEATLASARASVDPWIRGGALDPASAVGALLADVDPRLKRDAFLLASRGGLGLEAARAACADPDPWLRAQAAARLAREGDETDAARVIALLHDEAFSVRAAAADAPAAKEWLARRAAELRAEAIASPRAATSERAVSGEPPAKRLVPASARSLGRRGPSLSPLVLSGANEPSIGSLFRAMNEGCNAFFWEPRYRNLTTFLRTAADRGVRPLVVAGTYHASARAIRADVERACRRLRRDKIDVFLVFWTRSPARLDGEVPRVLERLAAEGKIGTIGFSTHDRALAESRVGSGPWEVMMIRHSAAHPGAEERLFPRAEAAGIGVLSFSATSYGRLLRAADPAITPPTAAECYRYSLSQPGVTACVCAPRGGVELIEDLEALRAPALDPARLAALRAHGLTVRAEALDFAAHIRRFPALPEALEACDDDDFSPTLDASWSPSQG